MPLEAEAPLGSLIYDPSVTGMIDPAGDTDSFTIDVDAGQTFTVLVTPAAGLQPTIELRDPANTLIGSNTGGAAGAAAILQAIPTGSAGTYTMTVSGAAGTTGSYNLRVILNAALDNESHDGPTNDTLPTAQDINGSFIDLTTGTAQRGAVLGSVSAPVLLFGSDQNGRYLQVNRLTGEATIIASGVNGGRGYTDLARNPVTGVLYGSGARGDNGFYVVNPVTGAGTLVGSSGNQVHSLAWSPDGNTLYAVRNFNEFGTIDAGTGAFTFISSAPYRVHGMAFHPVTGVLYAVPQTGELHAVNTSTGEFTFVGYNGIALLSLEFLPDGTLLGSGNGSLYSIDPASGAATFIGSTNVGTLIGLEGISSADSRDLYSFTMAPGQTGTLAVAGASSSLELLDSSGKVLALGVAAENLSQVISNFTASSTGTYYARVTSSGISDYSLVVTRDAAFDTENNNNVSSGQTLNTNQAALGYLTSVGQLLGADDGDRHLLLIDPATGAATVVASNVGGGAGYNDLALNPVTGVLYGSQALNSSGLYTIDTVSFAETFVGGLGGNVRALVWSPDGATFYGFRDSTFGSINPATAAFTPIGDPGIGVVGGMAFQPGTGTLFAVTNNRGAVGLYTIDPLTAAATLIGNPGNDYNSLEFLADGTLLAGVGRFGATPGFLVELDPLTAAPTLIGATVPSGFQNLTGLESLPATGDSFRINVQAGDSLVLSTLTPAGDPQEPFEIHNLLDPAIELYDPSGTRVADNDNGAPDGKYASLTWTALSSGTYTVRVFPAANTGEYVLSVSGATGALPSFNVTAVDPVEGLLTRVQPTQVTVDFSDSVLLTSLDASDLTVDGQAATGLTVVDGNTVSFFIMDPGEGTHTIYIAADSILDLQGTPLDEFTSHYTIDLKPPRVVASSIQEGDVLPAGSLTYTVTFSEPMNTANLDASDFLLQGNIRGIYYCSVTAKKSDWQNDENRGNCMAQGGASCGSYTSFD